MESNSSLCGKLLANEQRKLVCFCIQVTVNLRVVQAQQMILVVGVNLSFGTRIRVPILM